MRASLNIHWHASEKQTEILPCCIFLAYMFYLEKLDFMTIKASIFNVIAEINLIKMFLEQ